MTEVSFCSVCLHDGSVTLRLQSEVVALKERVYALETAAKALRQAQKDYMANRGNQEYGKQVAVKAKELDAVLSGEVK